MLIGIVGRDSLGKSRCSGSIVGVVLLWCLAQVAGASVPVVSVDEMSQPLPLSTHLEFFEDRDRTLTHEAILSGAVKPEWRRNEASQFIGRESGVRYWFRLQLEIAPHLQREDLILYVDHQGGLNYELTVYMPEGENDHRRVETGILYPLATRDMTKQQHGFRLTQGRQRHTIIGWVDHRYAALPALLPLKLVTRDQFNEGLNRYQGFLIAYYGIMGALIFYNACLFLYLREPVYGWYLLFLASATALCAFTDGTTMYRLWPNSPELNFRLSTFIGVGAIQCYLCFQYYALDKLEFSPRLRQLYVLASIISISALLYCVLTPNKLYAIAVSQLVSVLLVPITYLNIILAMKRGNPTAVYLLTAESAAMAGAFLYAMLLYGYIDVTPFSMWSLHVGYMGEALLLSLALAERTRRAQQDAITHLSNYQTIYEESVEGLFEYELASRSFHCNSAFAELFGYGTTDDISPTHNPLETFNKDDQQKIPLLLMEHGEIKRYETIVHNIQTDEDIWVSISMKMLCNEQGTPYKVTGSFRDITERKQREAADRDKQKAEQEKLAAEMANKAKTQFFASMSHEFRTPLTAILGYTELADDDDIPYVERRSHIKTIEHSANHMLQLINDILDLSKIEAQQMDVESLEVPLSQIIRETYDYVWILAKQKGVSFDIEYQYPLPESITTDPTRLKQALINLCANAVKFTFKGGVRVDISCDKESGLLTFSVNDTGVGLKEEQIDKLFGAFVQAEDSTSRKFGGTGLGLYLSRLIAQKLGGDIGVESEYGKGSTFSLSVSMGDLKGRVWLDSQSPFEMLGKVASNPDAGEIPEGAAQAQLDGALTSATELGETKVLIADDNEVNRRLVQFHLEKLGVSVVQAVDGVDALAKCLSQSLDLVLMDMEMPHLSGLQAVVLLRDRGYEVPIYALSGNVDENSVRDCVQAGFNGHLSKPLDVDRIKHVVESLGTQVSSQI